MDHSLWRKCLTAVTSLAISSMLVACDSQKQSIKTSLQQVELDTLIVNGQVYTGENKPSQNLVIGIKGHNIVYLSEQTPDLSKVRKVIDAKGKVVSPGFIDPHTHSISDLKSKDKNNNFNYLAQGVTSVFNGNDGGGSPHIKQQFEQVLAEGIGTNAAFFVGHGAVRQQVIGREAFRIPTDEQLSAMKELVNNAMEQGAFGLSTGLFYVPGTYAKTQEVVELAKVSAQHGGVYESHVRDESTYNIGVEAAIAEALQIGKKAKIPVHLAHIKALGVDVWGKSKAIVEMVEQAQQQGQIVTADQYPWRASGVRIHKATVPSWALAGSEEQIQARFKDTNVLPKLKAEMTENIRRRGGPESLLIVTSSQPEFEGKTLADLATQWEMSAVDAALKVMSYGVNKNGTRVASFNMSPEDIKHFMIQPWVMTSSDGTNGHPRKYASYPRKYQEYVVNKNLMPLHTYIYKSSGQVADSLKVNKRGYLRLGYFADINVWTPEEFKANADFSKWNQLTTGINYQLVNGQLTIDQGKYTGALPGQALKLNNREQQK